ncbi:MAG: amino acid adenylation domain-containing protein [Candidatus Eisenbacteria bacterium]|uniref:Amino acid adenylation domain-containing protein n=1 Tax=Eiseniibacteriota bacterium TaxID=2212470 RepID=A0A933SH47_UNCEI|nr:amino acid adenylation domain-containing protein [Candidatus Eisenbacteria bacterium]
MASQTPQSFTASAPRAHPATHDVATLLHAVFDRTAAAHPGVVAIDVPPAPGRERETLTYAEASRRSFLLAAQLAPWVRGECVVAIALPRTSAAIYVAMLGVMRAGAAYTCFEPSLAADRARHLLEDSGAVAVIVRAEDRAHFEALGVPPERLVTPDEHGASAHANGHHAVIGPASLAYVIYTSGTTGRPKGVLIEHRNIVNLVESDRGYFGLGPGDRCAQSSMCSYDSSVEEIWLAFGTGATLVLMDDETVRLGPDLVPWLQRERITVFCPPPTLLRMATCADPRTELPDLRLIYVGGEELPLDVAARWAPGRRLENGYGPTECAVTCVRTPVHAGEPVRIGWPVVGNRAHVLDEHGREVHEGVVGELWMGGAGLARGYLNQPALTAERFVTHPEFGRLYRTGDLARREHDGALVYLGRSDSQVKIRGHRVELSAIEASLCACDGVVAAACVLQGEAPLQELSAFLVTDGARPARIETVREQMRVRVPNHMQPAHYALVDSLPTRDASGKLDRSALPDIRPAAQAGRARVGSFDWTEGERVVAAAFAAFVPFGGEVGPDDDFFLDLGGNSLIAAQVISCLRTDASTASLTMRDLYEARTVRALAARIGAPAEAKRTDGPAPREALAGAASPGALAQLAFVAVSLVPAAALVWAVVFVVLPALERAMGTAALLLALPLLAFAAELLWLPLGLALTVAAKAALVGRYRAGRHPYLGSFHVRHWIVVHLAHTIPWALVQGSELGNACLRALGAKIGRDVHLHRGVDLADGGWDLLTIEDGATLGRDASLGIVEWHDRHVVFAPVRVGAGATLDTRAHVGGGATVERDGFLGALSSLADGVTLPAGELWRGVPAARVDEAVPPAPEPHAGARPWGPFAHTVALLAARAFSSWLPMLPGLLLALVLLRPGAAGTGLLPAPFSQLPLGWAPFVLMAGYAACLPMEAFVARLFGRVPEGAHPLRGATGIAIAMKEHAVETANAAISGTLLWPMWLRMAGTRVGRKCEISTVMEVVPELTDIGDECFFADGIYLGRPLLHRGHSHCARTRLSKNTFFGNHAVIPAGVSLPPGILLGICTVADPALVREGSSWFGNPPLELPRREIAESERELTHDPGFARFATRVVFESVRLVLPLGPLALAWGWFRVMPQWHEQVAPAAFFLLALPASFAAIGAVLLAAAVFVKWCVMGPIREGRHALWSCWCCRWDVLFEVWAAYAVPVLLSFEGTPFVSWWLRAMGCRIGHGVVFGSSFLQVVDPDMLEIGDGATVSCHLQSHSFEDRVLKLARVRIAAGSDVARGAVLLYGADIGERAEVAANSVVMKQELLLPGRRYEGCPTRAVR